MFGLSKQSEVLIIIIVGIIVCSLDNCLFKFQSNLEEIWNMNLDEQEFTQQGQLFLRYIMSSVVLVRTFSLHVFIALYIVMLWPAFFADRPSLLIPWLLVGYLRNIVTNLATLLTGLYVCMSAKGAHYVCGEYALAQFIDHGPAVYAWFTIFGYYLDLRQIPLEEYEPELEKKFDFDLAARRRRARYSMSGRNFTDDGRNLISESTITSIQQYLDRKKLRESRSLDTLLDLKAVEEEQEEIMSMSDELTTEPETKTLRARDRAMKLLKLSEGDIIRARRGKSERSFRMYSELALDTVTSSGKTHVLPTVSSESFFVKNGKSYKFQNVRICAAKLNQQQHQLKKDHCLLPVVVEISEVELGNVILENKTHVRNSCKKKVRL